jgi:HSP20 family molecular chaperone IbpA
MKAKKQKALVDPKSNVMRSLSVANDAVTEAYNHIASQQFVATANISPMTWNNNSATYSTASGSGTFNILGDNYTLDPITTSTLQQSYPPYVPSSYPKMDIVKVDNSKYIVKIYIAGVSKDRVSISLTEGNWVGGTYFYPSMTISINSSKLDEFKPEYQETEFWFMRESKQSHVSRIVTLPSDVNISDVSEAILENGVLQFEFPVLPVTKEPAQSKSVTIK